MGEKNLLGSRVSSFWGPSFDSLCAALDVEIRGNLGSITAASMNLICSSQRGILKLLDKGPLLATHDSGMRVLYYKYTYTGANKTNPHFRLLCHKLYY